jgi:hypothetical protein
MIAERDNVIWHKANGLVRYLLAHSATKLFPLYVVNEYPKSGGSWIGEMVAESLSIPFPRNRLPVFGASVLHGHMMHAWNMHNILIVWRDGRDVLVSQYYHFLFRNERGNGALVDKTRRDLRFTDYSDIQNNLPRFMDYVFEAPKHPRFNWVDFGNRWAESKRCTHVKYESMRHNPVGELRRVVRELSGTDLSIDAANRIVENQSFSRASGRKPGEENRNSFLRKGVVGDWSNHFNAAAKRRFDALAGDLLIKLGYELNHDWAKSKASQADFTCAEPQASPPSSAATCHVAFRR